MDAIFCIRIEWYQKPIRGWIQPLMGFWWYNQPMVFLLTLQISYSFFKFIRKYFEAYTSVDDQNVTFPLFVLFQILQLVEF